MKTVFSKSNTVIAHLLLFRSSGGLNGHHFLRCFVLKFLWKIIFILVDIFIFIIFFKGKVPDVSV